MFPGINVSAHTFNNIFVHTQFLHITSALLHVDKACIDLFAIFLESINLFVRASQK